MFKNGEKVQYQLGSTTIKSIFIGNDPSDQDWCYIEDYDRVMRIQKAELIKDIPYGKIPTGWVLVDKTKEARNHNMKYWNQIDLKWDLVAPDCSEFCTDDIYIKKVDPLKDAIKQIIISLQEAINE